jgi:hypothetical protein
LKGIDIYGWVVLRDIVKTWDRELWTGFIGFGIGTRGGFLVLSTNCKINITYPHIYEITPNISAISYNLLQRALIYKGYVGS